MRPQARRQRKMPSEQLKRTSNGKREPRGVTPRKKKPKPRKPKQPARRPNATPNSPPKKHPSLPRAARATSKQPPRSPAASISPSSTTPPPTARELRSMPPVLTTRWTPSRLRTRILPRSTGTRSGGSRLPMLHMRRVECLKLRRRTRVLGDSSGSISSGRSSTRVMRIRLTRCMWRLILRGRRLLMCGMRRGRKWSRDWRNKLSLMIVAFMMRFLVSGIRCRNWMAPRSLYPELHAPRSGGASPKTNGR